jgi:general secretion pathway protein I
VSRRGFSLLELILALAILGGAVAVLGEAASLAMRNAEFAREMGRAQLLCEGKLAEILAGAVPLQTVSRAKLSTAAADPDEPAWLYSVEKTSLGEDQLVSIRVTVTRDLPPEKRPIQYSLVRWMIESEATQSSDSTESSQQSDSSSSSSSSSAAQQ